MNLRNLSVLLFATGALLALTGCSTFESRSKQKAAAFSTLDAATQARLKVGEIHLGDTMDEVYISLGYPDEKRDITTEKGKTTAWIYSTYWQQYQGQAFGTVPVYTKNPTTGNVSVSYVPVSQPVYANRSEERLRISFKDGLVTIIEKAR